MQRRVSGPMQRTQPRESKDDAEPATETVSTNKGVTPSVRLSVNEGRITKVSRVKAPNAEQSSPPVTISQPKIHCYWPCLPASTAASACFSCLFFSCTRLAARSNFCRVRGDTGGGRGDPLEPSAAAAAAPPPGVAATSTAAAAGAADDAEGHTLAAPAVAVLGVL